MTARLHHADLYGPRQSKYDALKASRLETIEWQTLSPNAPHYLFMPQAQAFRQEYEAGWAVNEVFPTSTVGVVTGQDGETVAFSDMEANALAEKHGVEATAVQPHLYRPFDIRRVVYSERVVVRTRSAVMRHMHSGRNIALVTTRMTRDEWDCSVSNTLIGHKALAAYDISYLFPLWRYPTEQEAALGIEREANIAPAFIAELTNKTGETPAPEDIFHYAYAVFHAPAYRTRYAAFLKTDFPRLPLPPDADAFRALAALGATLTALHLLEAPGLARHGIAFPVGGDHRVKKMRREDRYAPPTPGGAPGRVRLNDAEYFDNVPPEAWQFQVGGYQPAFKWLDDRKDRRLTADDIDHYRRTLAALRDTSALLPQLDAAFLPLINDATPADPSGDAGLKEKYADEG